MEDLTPLKKSFTKQELLDLKKKVENAILGDGVIDDLEVNVFVKEKKKKDIRGGNWLFLFQDTEFVLARSLSPGACRLIMLFRAICKYENKVSYDIREMMKLLGVTRQTVSNALTELKDKGIIIDFKDESDRRKKVYYINPESQWKGKILNTPSVRAIFDSQGAFAKVRESNNPKQLNLIDAIKIALKDEESQAKD